MQTSRKVRINRKYEEILNKIKGGEKLIFQSVPFKPVNSVPIPQGKF